MCSKFFVVCLLSCLYSAQLVAYSIVFVHIGKQLPPYLQDALSQARLFNETCDIYLLANQQALRRSPVADKLQIHAVPLETLHQTKAHKNFIKTSALDHQNGNGFWFCASERFLYLDDFMQQFDMQQVFHLESDNMLYVNLAELMPIFLQKYSGIAATFDNDNRCIPGFVYIANKKVIHELAKYFAQYAHMGKNDMVVLGLFRQRQSNQTIDNLPIIMSSYRKKYPLKSTTGLTSVKPNIYSKNIEEFNSIFDGAALGQYLGGVDPIHGVSKPGFINESCLFNPSRCSYIWQLDSYKRKIPIIVLNDEAYRINNLHIHSKNLKNFSSV